MAGPPRSLGSDVQRALESFLLGDTAAMPSIEVLRATNTAAYAFTRLPAGHSARDVLRSDYLEALTRHRAMKAEVLELVRAWNAANIVPLIYKGFYLAEFVYPVPGARYHGDVDVIIEPHEAQKAVRAGRELEWRIEFEASDSLWQEGHEGAHLRSSSGVTYVELHRLITQTRLGLRSVQERVTRAVLAAATPLDWEGVTVLIPRQEDSWIVGVCLNRSWGSDRWTLKPHDAPDGLALAARLGLTRDAALARAEELGVRRSIDTFMERCDPWAGRFDLSVPTPPDMRRLDARTAAEVGYSDPWARADILRRAPGAIVDVLRELPNVIRVSTAMRQYDDAGPALAALSPRRIPPRPASALPRWRAQRGVQLALRLYPLGRKEKSVLRPAALFHSLARLGYPVEFVSGVRLAEGARERHAWVELDGSPLIGTGDESAPTLFREVFRVTASRAHE